MMIIKFKVKKFKKKLRQITSILISHKILIILLTIFLILGGTSLGIRNYFLAKMQLAEKDSSGTAFSDYSPLPITPPDATDSATSSVSDVLGASYDNSTSNNNTDAGYIPPVLPTPLPNPIISPVIIPTLIPISSSSQTATSSSCTGTPNADNSQVYISPSFTVVGGSSTITVNLQDCNNSKVSNDNLTITLSSGDSSVTVNGKNIGSGYQASTQNGVYTFQVSAGVATTAVFNIQDTSHNFSVTMPGYKQPTLTFSSSGSNSASSNPNCTTGAGIPNSWYSDVYPPSGSVDINSTASFTVVIRDCFKNPVSNDSIDIVLTSGDSSIKVNGDPPTKTMTVSGGQGGFTVTSAVATTAVFTVNDTSGHFTVTDPNNHNPQITFTGSASSPTLTPADSSTPTPAPTQTATSSASPTPP